MEPSNKITVGIGSSPYLFPGLLIGFLTVLFGLATQDLATANASKPGSGLISVGVSGLEWSLGGSASVTVKQLGKKPRGQTKKIRKSFSTSRNMSRLLKGLPNGRYQIYASALRLSGYNKKVSPTVKPKIVKLIGKRPRVRVSVRYRGRLAPPKFNFSNAIALATTKTSGRNSRSVSSARVGAKTKSNLLALLPSGVVRDAIEAGYDPRQPWDIRVLDFLVGPDNAVYLIFNFGIVLEPTPEGVEPERCVLVRVERESGNASCVDKTLTQVVHRGEFGGDANGGIRFDEPVQFGQDGSLYYRGWVRGDAPDYVPSMVLRRKNLDGTFTELIPRGRVSISGFWVSPGGFVLMKGSNLSGTENWFRRVSPEGELANLSRGSWSPVWDPVIRLSDGKLYVGDSQGLFPFDDGLGNFSNTPWIGPKWINPEHSYEDYCDPDESHSNGDFLFCTGYFVGAWVSTQDQRDFMVDRNGQIAQIYPEPRVISPKLFPGAERIKIRAAGNSVLMVSRNSNIEQDTLVSVDLSTGRDTVLIGPDKRLEIYNLQYFPTENRIYFDALAFASNQYVFGSLDLGTGELRYEPAAFAEWEQFVALD